MDLRIELTEEIAKGMNTELEDYIHRDKALPLSAFRDFVIDKLADYEYRLSKLEENNERRSN